VGIFLDELCDVVVLALHRHIAWKPIHVVWQVGVGSSQLEKNLGDLEAALASCEEQRRLVVLVLKVHVRVVADQHLGSFLVVHCRRPVQRRAACNTSRTHIQVKVKISPDLGSSHTAYRHASLVDLYLHTKFH